MRRAANIGRLQRDATGRLWSAEHFDAIRAHVVSDRDRSAASPVSIASVVTEPWTCFDSGACFREVLLTDGTFKDTLKGCTALVASYLGHHAQKSCHWASRSDGGKHRGNNKPHFSDSHFDHRYREPLKMMLGSKILGLTDSQIGYALTEIRRCFRKTLTETTAKRSLGNHIMKLEKYAAILRGKDFGYSCALCLVEQWDVLLPCGQHGVCDSCMQQYEGYCQNTCTVVFQKCHVCMCEFDDWPAQSYNSSIRGSILSLDGGGVRGLIQLEVLRCIEDNIGVGLPLMRFFDLMVGTSIGTICLRQSYATVLTHLLRWHRGLKSRGQWVACL